MTLPSVPQVSSTTPCAIANGGSACVGASACSAGTFRNDCTTSTNTLRYSEITAEATLEQRRADALHDIARTYLAAEPDDRSGEDRHLVVVQVSAESLVEEVAEDLVRAGLMARHRRGGLLPARAPEELTLADLTLAVHGVYSPVEPGAWSPPRAPGFEALDAFFRQSDALGLDVLRRTRWLDLAVLERPGLARVYAPPPDSATEPARAVDVGNP